MGSGPPPGAQRQAPTADGGLRRLTDEQRDEPGERCSHLDHHLKHVVACHEPAGAAVFGLSVGVGLDMSPYCRRSQVLNLSKAVTMAVFRELIGMIARPRSA